MLRDIMKYWNSEWQIYESLWQFELIQLNWFRLASDSVLLKSATAIQLAEQRWYNSGRLGCGVGLYGCCHDSKCEFELYKDLWNWLTVSLGLLFMAFRDALLQLVADWVRIGTHNWQFCSIRQLYFELLNCVKYIQIKTGYMSGWILAVVWSISIHFG